MSYEEVEEKKFCESRVNPYSWEFLQYWWSWMVSRCEWLETQWNNAALVSKRYYYNRDRIGSIGSIVWIMNSSGTNIIEYEYNPYGEVYIKKWWNNIWIESYTWDKYENSRLYTAREYEEWLWIYYNRARYYDAKMWRFMSRDPIDINDQINLYSYVNNNPVNFTDPMGREKKILFINMRYDDWRPDYFYYPDSSIKKAKEKKWVKDSNFIRENVKDKSELDSILDKYSWRNIVEVMIEAHGSPTGIQFGPESGLDWDNYLSTPEDYSVIWNQWDLYKLKSYNRLEDLTFIWCGVWGDLENGWDWYAERTAQYLNKWRETKIWVNATTKDFYPFINHTPWERKRYY